MNKVSHYQLYSRLNALPTVSYGKYPRLLSPEQAKKHARIHVSLAKTSTTLGFLHACLVKIDERYFLFAGASGVGKTTYAEGLRTSLGAEILANDWVAVEKQGSDFFVSDLNFKTELRQREPGLLSGIIFLLPKDPLHRDAFVPNEDEYRQLLAAVFAGSTKDDVAKLSMFWLENTNDLPFYCAVPTKQKPARYVRETITLLLQRIRPKDAFLEVGIVGIGSVGVHLAALLGQLPCVRRVHLFDHSKDKVVGYAMDLNQALNNGRDDVYIAHDSPEDLYKRSSSVFLAFRDRNAKAHDPTLPERWKKVESHVAILADYARTAARVNFAGNVLVLTNPVDYLASAYHSLSQTKSYGMRTFQVFGLGLETDMARASYYGKQYSPTFDLGSMRIYGNHADDFTLFSTLSGNKNTLLLQDIVDGSQAVRDHDIRTVFGPVSAAVRTYLATIQDNTTNVTVIQDRAFIGRGVAFKFGLPCSPQTNEQHAYKAFVHRNRKLVKKYDYLVRRHVV